MAKIKYTSGDDYGNSVNHADNTIYALAGNDTISAGFGNDTMYGGAGRDALDGSAGNDLMYGGADGDTLFTGGGNDRAYGGADNDKIVGDSGNNALYGGAGDDKIWGWTPFSALGALSAQFANTLDGGLGTDTLLGGSGNDTLRGGQGSDEMSGNGGDDLFFWRKGDVTKAPGSLDHVTDLSAGDKLDMVSLLRTIVTSHSARVHVTDTAGGDVISVQMAKGGAFVDVVMLDGQHGNTAADLISSGALLI